MTMKSSLLVSYRYGTLYKSYNKSDLVGNSLTLLSRKAIYLCCYSLSFISRSYDTSILLPVGGH